MTEAKYKIVAVGRGGGSTTAKEYAEELARVNAEFIETPARSEDEVIEAAKDADVIIIGIVSITRRIMENLPKCKAIMVPAVGYDSVDVDAATDNNIIVVNLPASVWCVEEVSNHAIMHLIACAKKLTMLHNLTRQGKWVEAKQAQPPMVSIHGQTLGLIGCGSIGRMAGRKAHCFGMKVIGYDPYVDKSLVEKDNITLVSLTELLKESDFVSVHTFLNEDTFHLMGEKEFKQMRPAAYFINTSRGKVVDEPALIKALQEKWIAGAGLDVFEKEPVDPANPLLKMDNVTVTPHDGSFSDVAWSLPQKIVLEEAIRVLSGRWPENAVNISVQPKVDLVKEE